MITIRLYRLSDRKALIHTIDEVCGGCAFMDTTHYVPTPAWEHALADPDCPAHRLFLAADGPQIVGWLRLFPPVCFHRPTEVELGIGILLEYRRKGIGTMLMQAALEWSAAARARAVKLDTRIRNQPARRLFSKFGFQPFASDGTTLQMMVALNERVPSVLLQPGGAAC